VITKISLKNLQNFGEMDDMNMDTYYEPEFESFNE